VCSQRQRESDEAMTGPVVVEGRKAVTVLTLHRPERRNAVDHATLLALDEAITSVAGDGTRVVVLTGTPPAFSAGADLSGVEEGEFTAALGMVLRGFTELPLPVVGAIDGPALGAGSQLAAVCDLRVATPTSRFGIPAARLGLVVDQWTVRRLSQEFTPPIARAMLVAAETFDAARLHAAGAVHRLGTLDDALTWAEEIADLAPLTIAGHKLALERNAHAPEDDPDVESVRSQAWESDDALEGRAAFMEKRSPRFTGR
jgi:enoyl-CoA hydratase